MDDPQESASVKVKSASDSDDQLTSNAGVWDWTNWENVDVAAASGAGNSTEGPQQSEGYFPKDEISTEGLSDEELAKHRFSTEALENDELIYPEESLSGTASSTSQSSDSEASGDSAKSDSNGLSSDDLSKNQIPSGTLTDDEEKQQEPIDKSQSWKMLRNPGTSVSRMPPD